MAVQNYLEEEDYDIETIPSVPNFLADEDDAQQFSNPVLMEDQTEYDETEGDQSRAANHQIAEEVAAHPPVPTAAEWREMVARGEVKGYEHPNKDKDANSASKKKRKPGTKYHRRDITEKDLLVMAFLERFKLATTKQIAILLDVQRGSANWRLLGLKEIGIVGQEKIPTMPVLWYLTAKGKRTLDDAFHFDDRAPKNLHTPGSVNSGSISHILFEAQVAAQLSAGLKPLGGQAHMDLDGTSGRDLMKNLVDEHFMRSAWGKATYRKNELGKQQAQRGYEVTQRAAAAIGRGELAYSDLLRANPSMWTLTVPVAYRGETKEFHYPDLVLDLEHLRTSAAPVSYAVEIELSPKSPQELEKILSTFKFAAEKSPVPVYKKIVYLIADEKVRRGVIKAAKKVGLTSNDMTILAITDFEGQEFTGKAWDL